MSIVLVTGANRGIGAAITRSLAAAGHTVFAGRRNPDGPSELADAAGDIRPVTLDVTDGTSVQRAIDTVVEQAGALDVLVNNAGVAWFAAAEEMSEHVLRRTMETNFFGAIACTQAALPVMRRQHGGHVITISSIAAAVGLPLESAYCASKSAVEAFSESLRHEVAPFGIAVSVIEPGITEGGLSNSAADPFAPPRSNYAALLTHTFDFYAASQDALESPALITETIAALLDDPTPPFRVRLGHYAPFVDQLQAAPEADAAAMLREALGIGWWHDGDVRPAA